MKRLMRSAATGHSRLVERGSRSKLLLVRHGELHTLPERIHLRRFIKHFAIDCIFDVGANIGQSATMLRQQVGYQGLIVSFEPIPKCADHVRALAKGDPLWQIEEVALADHVGVDSFNIMASNQFSSLASPDHSAVDIFQDHNKIVRSVEVKVDLLTNYYRMYRERFGFTRLSVVSAHGTDLRL
ncbi:FkbM family methyltransferase [Ancylobacter polymorphus]|uniref:FkbM family methyltransferase n=1 Tax=Ancylobacter polymorphus TaxID=223390 RepID=UPI002445B80C|nr:FkbM family methyltransferase [Ancylobacter polymorphus]